MKRETIISILAAMMVASCSEEFDRQELAAPVPLKLTAEVGEPATRISDDGTSFTAGEAIGIVDVNEDGDKVYKYKLGDDNTWSADGDAYYYKSADTDVSFAAYFPTDQDFITSTELDAVDFLHATATGRLDSKTNGAVNFTFYHKMSLLKVSLVDPNATTDADATTTVSEVTLSNLATKGSYNIKTGVVTPSTTTGSVNLTVGVPTVIFPQENVTPTISFTMNNNNYSATLASQTFSPGYSYQCTITVISGTEISVTTEIEPWTEVNGDAFTEDKTPIYSYGSIPSASDEVKLFSLAFSDGSFENIFDDTKNDSVNLDKINSLNRLQLENVCGIVFTDNYNPTTSDKVLEADYPNCTHGLIMSLANVESKEYTDDKGRMHWSNNNRSIPYVGEGSSYTGKGYGYKFTKYLKAYNNSIISNNESRDYLVYPVYALATDYENVAAPAGTSGWFIPSASEGYDLFNVYKNLETILSALNNRYEIYKIDKSITLKLFDADSYYIWTSSENKTSDEKEWGVWINKGKPKISSSEKKKTSYYVRAVCAF